MTDVDKEIAAYDKIQADLETNHMGKWVVIKDENLVGRDYAGFLRAYRIS